MTSESQQRSVTPDPRLQRRQPEELDEIQRADHRPDYRIDLERVRFSPYFSRLSAVTQVISQAGASPLIHNRLTHSLKVTAVARAIAVAVDKSLIGTAPALSQPGGCDAVVVQAAASAHDLGHPPFGHLGENVLNRLARTQLGLADGFEGNAQTYRIIAALDVCDGAAEGLNLTAAVRTAVSKYPWTPALTGLDVGAGGALLPRGLGRRPDGTVVARKYSAYFLEGDDLAEARRSAPGLEPWEQSLECSVMDIADDIAYSIHDVDDFYRAGILSQVAVAREFRGWSENWSALRMLAAPDPDPLTPATSPVDLAENAPGAALESLRRRIHRDDPWIADDDAFADAVAVVSEDLVEGLLSTVFDGSIAAERVLSTFTSRWIAHFERSIVAAPAATPRTGIVSLDRRAWHEVKVLKFVHKHFILNRPDIAMYQRGLSQVLVTLVNAFTDWLDDADDRKRVPRRMLEMVDLATVGYKRLAVEHPELLAEPGAGRGSGTDGATLRRLGRGRGVIDYVASLSDGQAIAVAEALNGRTDRLWDIGQSL